VVASLGVQCGVTCSLNLLGTGVNIPGDEGSGLVGLLSCAHRYGNSWITVHASSSQGTLLLIPVQAHVHAMCSHTVWAISSW